MLTLAALAGIGSTWLVVEGARPERAGTPGPIHESAFAPGSAGPGGAAPPRIASPALPEPASLQAVHLPVVKVVLELGAEVPEPRGWRLVVRRGDETVAERFHGGSERELELELAPGNYSLAAEASGAASLPVPLELERSTDVTLLLQPLSTLAGAVVDGEGAGVAGLPVHWRRARALERSTSTDAFGAFQLEGLVRGAGELVLGDPRSPILPPRALELVAGLLDLGSIPVPQLGELLVRVVDENDVPVAAALLSGSGDQGGSIDARSDLDGLARAAFLPPGMYRVFASHPALGRGNTVFEFAPGEPSPVQVRLRRAALRE